MTTSTSERPRISFVSRPLLTGVIAITLAIGACGRDSIAPLPSAAAVTVFSGDGQQAEWSQALPAPLVALVTTTDGTPVANAKVNWGVYSGGGSLSSTSSMTDQTGKASVSWTLGSTGSQVVKAWLDVAAPA